VSIRARVLIVLALGFIAHAAATPLTCAGDTPCPTLRKILGTCESYLPDEISCKTEARSLISPAGSSKTYFAYYPPPPGYAFVPGTARGVESDGRGTHGVDGSITPDERLYCLWGAAGTGSYGAGYCEVKARQIAPPKE
jgi:hypothetical protein